MLFISLLWFLFLLLFILGLIIVNKVWLALLEATVVVVDFIVVVIDIVVVVVNDGIVVALFVITDRIISSWVQ